MFWDDIVYNLDYVNTMPIGFFELFLKENKLDFKRWNYTVFITAKIKTWSVTWLK